MQHIGIELANALIDSALREYRESDFGIGRTRERAEFEWSEEPHLVTHLVEFTCRGLECAHHAVDLWFPGVCDKQDSQEFLLTS
jgi:hypothetical protein